MAQRRPRGEGTVYYDAKRDRWIGAATVAGKRKKVTGKDKTQARKRLLEEVLAKRATGTPIPNRRVTVADAVAVFLERGVPNRRTGGGRPLAPSTLDEYAWSARIITDEIGKVRLAELHVDDIEAMFDRLANRKPKGLGASSLRKIRGTLQRSLAFAERRGDIDRNPAAAATITPTAAPSIPRRALAPDQARKLLEAARGERLGAMYGLMLRVGLRPGEAAGLYWVDLADDVLNVTRARRMEAGQPVVVDDLKTQSAKRTIQLPADVAAWLADHRAAQVAERLAAPSWGDDRLMFTSTTGTVLDPPNVRRDLARICRETELPEVRPNELRHSCASLLADLGVPNEQIADLLGHTTTRMVDQHYRHRLRPVVDIAATADWTAER